MAAACAPESPGPDQGSTFTLHLPLSIVHRSALSYDRLHPRTEAGQRGEYPLPDLSGIRVIVVDDDPDGLDLLRHVLAEQGAEAATAGNADEALTKFAQSPPDVLISDIGMPGVDGYEFLKRVRALEQPSGERVPAIALTAFARSQDRTRVLNAGFLVHLAKPVQPSELVATVASVMGRTNG